MLSHTCPQRHLLIRQQHNVASGRASRLALKSSFKSTKRTTSTPELPEQFVEADVSRRHALQAAGVSMLLPLLGWQGAAPAEAQEASTEFQETPSSAEVLQPYLNTQQQYQLSIPAAWEKKDKAGADVLFEDPGRRSTSVGVTVSPVRVASIQQFGDLDTVGNRLLEAERRKESTLDVQLLSSSSRSGSAGATLYDYEYQLESTRGVKRIFNTVTITGSKLYILNGAYKCDKEAGCAAAEAGPIAVLRQVAASFDAGATA